MRDSLGKPYADGAVVVREGEAGNCMYVVQRGRVEVTQKEDGHEVRLAVLEQGAIFGEMALFEREVRSATVRALGEAHIMTIDKRTFFRRVQEDPSLAFNILKELSRRLRGLNVELARIKAAPNGGPAE